MSPLQQFVLPADVVMTPMDDLSPDMRTRVDHELGDHVVTRPHTRTASTVVDARLAALLERFREPATIVDAVIAFASTEALDARETLESAFGALAALIDDAVLVPVTSHLAEPITVSFPVGTLVDELEIVEAAHLLDDTEVYRARSADGEAVALKIAGIAAGRESVAAILHEATILKRLDGRVNPALLRTGVLDDRPFLVTAWSVGVDLYQAGNELRSLGSDGGQELLALSERTLEAYAHLHAQGVLHGDVQPRNVIVDASGGVSIIDFGLAAVPAEGVIYMRGGVDVFLSPEEALARLGGDEPVPPTPASEQYSIAALIYFLLTGSHTHPFSLQPGEMLRQVVDDPPLPFHSHGVAGLAPVERCLQRSLAKDPSERHGSVAHMLRAFSAAASRERLVQRTTPSLAPPRDVGRELLARVLERIEAPSELFLRGLERPTASVTYGAAGIAYMLLRVARSRGDERLLAHADLWAVRAAESKATDGAFWNPDLQIVPETFGRVSLFHHASGVHCVESLIANARGDDRGQLQGVDRFLSTSAGCDHIDLAFGKSGLLLGCAILLEALPHRLESSSLRSFGNELAGAIMGEILRAHPTSGESPPTLGAAHGWAGVLLAVLRWHEATGTPPPAEIRDRLIELASLGQPVGRGLAWPRKAGERVEDSLLTASWCNGAAGYVQLWTLAARLCSRDARFDDLAESAAWTAYEGVADAPGELCCGLAGRAYALLSRYEHTEDGRWLTRARSLAARAAARPMVPSHRANSLFHGEIGIAVLVSDLEAPGFASMPLVEPEGWLDDP